MFPILRYLAHYGTCVTARAGAAKAIRWRFALMKPLLGMEYIDGVLVYTYYPVVDSYWDTETSGWDTSTGGEGKTTAEMTTQTTFSGWDFTDVWTIEDGVSYPCLQWTGSACATPE